jgi:hypothetical protein
MKMKPGAVAETRRNRMPTHRHSSVRVSTGPPQHRRDISSDFRIGIYSTSLKDLTTIITK